MNPTQQAEAVTPDMHREQNSNYWILHAKMDINIETQKMGEPGSPVILNARIIMRVLKK